MDLNRLAVFSRVVEEGSLTKAAQALHLPKSSVSRNITLLEEELGMRLLHRSSRKVTVTEVGAAYHAQVAQALASIDDATASLAEQQTTPKGTVRITASFDAGSDHLIPIIARFVAKYPSISVDVALSGRHVDLAEEGVDLGLRAGVVRDQSLVARKVAEIRFAMYASREYVRKHGAPTTLDELRARECVIFKGANGRVTWTLSSDRRTETVEVQGPISVDDMGASRSAVLAGAGIGFLPPIAAAKEVTAGRVVRVLPEWSGPPTLLSLVYPSARLVPQRVVLFREFLLAELALIPWSCTNAPSEPEEAGARKRKR
jgi:DNA-binding transcriptional LysR family regulator